MQHYALFIKIYFRGESMKKSLKYIFTTLLIALSSFAFVACGDTPPSDPPGTPPDTPPSGTLYGAWVDNSLSDRVTVTLSKTQAYAGETIDISYTVQPGYKVRWFDIMRSWQDEWGAWQNEIVDTVLDSFVMPEHNVSIFVNIAESAVSSVMSFEYNEPTDSYALTGWSATVEQIVPSTYDDGVHGTKPVTIIRTEWQFGLDMVTVIRLPETITTIEEQGFSLPSYVKSINIPSSVTNFYNREVTDIIDLGVMEVINHSAFNVISREGKVVTESNLYKTSDSKAYFIVGEKTQLVGIKSQENQVFPSRGATLKNFENPSKTTTLGNYDIYGYYCTDNRDIIKTITLGQGTIKVLELKYGPFLHEITLNQELKDFRDGLGLAKIETLTLPDSLEYWAGISYNNKIRNIVIGAGSKLKAITGDVCNNKHITLNEYQGAKYLPSASNDYFMLVSVNNHNTSELNIHPSCKVISSHTVWGEPNEVITELTIPASVRGVSDGFLSGAIALEKVTIEDGSCLEYFAYNFNEKYNSVLFPASVTKLAGILPDITYFQAKNVELDVQEDPYNQLKIFYDVDILVDHGDCSYALTHADEAYLTYWDKNKTASDLRTIDGYPIVYIGERVFEDNRKVCAVQLSNKLRYIGRFAFYECSSMDLDILDCPELKFIGHSAFEGIDRINVAKIPKGCYVDQDALPAAILAIEDTKADFDRMNVSSEFVWTAYKFYSYSDSINRVYYECKTSDDYYHGAYYSIPYGQTEPAKYHALIKYLGSDLDIVVPSTIDGTKVNLVAPFCYSFSAINTLDSLSTDIGLDSGSLYYATNLTSVKTPSFTQGIFCINLKDNTTLYTPANHLKYVESNYFSTTSIISQMLPVIETIVVHEEYYSLTGCKAKNITLPYLNTFLGEVYRAKGRPDFPPSEDEQIQSHHMNVPSSLKNLTITGGEAIGDYHLANCSSIETVTLGSSVAYIGEYSFKNCSGLTSIELPGVETVDGYAFYNCVGLKNVVFDYPLLTMDDCAFQGCTNLEIITYSLANPNATFEATIPDVGYGINPCKNFKYFNIVNTPNLDMTKLDLDYWNLIDETTVSYSTLSQAKVAFKGDAPSGFEDDYKAQFTSGHQVIFANFYDNVTGIENNGLIEYMVYDTNKACILKGLSDSVTSLAIPGLIVESIDSGAFMDMGITSITIPDSVTSIRMEAFRNCTSLSQVTMPSGLKHIGWCAFYDCTSLGSITIPASVDLIHNYVFTGCSSLSSVDIKTTQITSIPAYTFKGCKSLTSFHLPSYIKDIGDYAFYNTGITTFTGIEDGVLETIGKYAFVNETKSPQLYVNIWTSIPFRTLHFPDTLISVGDRAFTNCTTLEEITFGNKIEYIGSEAFSDGKFTTLVLPDSLTHIGSGAFSYNEDLTTYKGPVNSSGTVSFIGTGSEYTSSITHIEVTSGSFIGAGCFTYFSELTSVVIGESFWDFFYSGEYEPAITHDLDYLTIPCLKGRLKDFTKINTWPFRGTIKITGKAGCTEFPLGKDSLYYYYTINESRYFADYTCLDLRDCLFTEANVQLRADVDYVLMPSTLETLAPNLITAGMVVLSSPLKDSLKILSNNDMSLGYMFNEDVTIDDTLWQTVNESTIAMYYVYTMAQYDYIKAKDYYASVRLYYTDGMTKVDDVYYWTEHMYGYPRYA